jgi:hypothetical protein
VEPVVPAGADGISFGVCFVGAWEEETVVDGSYGGGGWYWWLGCSRD